jgi:hypothetical protein
MTLYAYMTDVAADEDKPIEMTIEEDFKWEPKQALELFLEYTAKYPELLEYPSGVQEVICSF